MPAPTVVVLAAGQGTRMRSTTPKMLHPLCGLPLVAWPIHAARGAGAERVVVVDGADRVLDGALPPGVEVAVQEQPLGTGDAVRAGVAGLPGEGTVLVVNGDVPLITPEALGALLATHERARAAATITTIVLDRPEGYGRVVRGPDGTVERVVETKLAADATPEQLEIREVNAGVYAFDLAALRAALGTLRPANAQGELYLPDVLPAMRAAGRAVVAHLVTDAGVMLGVNDRVELAEVRALAQRRIHEAHQRAGVTIVDPASTTIDAGVALGQDTVVEPSSFLRGTTRAGERCTIGPLTTLIDTELGDEVTVPHSYLHGARAAAGAIIGPFAYLRPGAELAERAKAGTFVEVKNSRIGRGTKVPHLSYIGDADVGEGSNIGAGNITANYDGQRKHRTTIGDRVRTSVDTSFVAPVTVGDDAYTGAGSVITDDVPPGALGIARARQVNVEGYAERRKQR